MATYQIKERHPNIHRITNDVSTSHTVTNNTPSKIVAGVVVETTRGSYPIEHLDTATMIELAPGAQATIDPTAVGGATGIGFADPRNIVEATASFYVSEEVATPRKSKK